MSDQNHSADSAPRSNDAMALEIPAFGRSPALRLTLEKTKLGESRLLEAKMVNPVTYADLEHCFNDGWRELSRHHATVGFEKLKAEKSLELAKSVFLIDKYYDIIKDRPKSQDTADLRKAYLMRDQAYLDALDHVNRLTAIEAFLEGRMKVFEKTCAYMKKRMDLLSKSGIR